MLNKSSLNLTVIGIVLLSYLKNKANLYFLNSPFIDIERNPLILI